MGARVLAITNVVGSSMDRAADKAIHTNAGPEIWWPPPLHTAFHALHAGACLRQAAAPGAGKGPRAGAAMRNLPEQAAQALPGGRRQRLRSRFRGAHGRCSAGANYPAALEGALKLKEVSYIHAQGYTQADEARSHRPGHSECPTAVAVPGRLATRCSQHAGGAAHGGPIIAVGVEGDMTWNLTPMP